MDDAPYIMAVADIFRRIVKACDLARADHIDVDVTDEMILITNPITNEKVLINTQRAVQQIWVSGNGEGVHFACTAHNQWLDNKGTGRELLSWIQCCILQATGERIVI